MSEKPVIINRAPVLTLWAAIVAECMGYDTAEALSLGKAVAGLNAQSKGRMLGIYGQPESSEDGTKPKKTDLGEEFWVDVCGRGVPVKQTEDGIRAVIKDKIIQPDSVKKYIETKFFDEYERVKREMESLASSYPKEELRKKAYSLYEKFRPDIPAGRAGWGAKGELKLDVLRTLAK